MASRAYEYGKLFEPQTGLKLVERKARRALSYCLHKLRIDEIPLPIPIDQWIETAFGIRFGVADLSHLGPRVLGASFLRDREILVSDAALANEGRFHFTCAHELAHFVLHEKVRDQFEDYDEPETVLDDKLEREADRFAAAFLMPVNLLEREIVLFAKELGAEPRWCLTELMTPTDQSESLWKNVFVPALMRRFGVSKTAALIRCYGLRLKGPDQRTLLPMRFFYEMLPTPPAVVQATTPARKQS